jgi:hypothetical protein
MPYVIKAVSTSGFVTWLTLPGVGGCRSMAPRSNADVLSTLVDAWGAIAEMPWVFSDAGIRFSVVETYEEDEAEHAGDSLAGSSRPQSLSHCSAFLSDLLWPLFAFVVLSCSA